MFILGKAFNALALLSQLIYNTKRFVVQLWHLIRYVQMGAIIEVLTWTNIPCRNSSTTWSDRSRSHRSRGNFLFLISAGDQYFFLNSFILSLFFHRYLEYFIGLLSGEIKINSLPLYLRFIKMESPPCMHHKISYHENEWSSFIKIFEGEKFVFISGKDHDRLCFRDKNGLWEKLKKESMRNW